MDSPKPIRYTIYCHIHIESGRRYTGLTKKTMAFRWNQHLQNALKKRGKGCAHFWAAIRKYGKDAFSHEVLETCSDLDQSNLAEEWWIRWFRTRDPQFGFNLKRGGSHTPHPVRNPWDRPEFREKALALLAKANNVSLEERSERTRKLWEDPKFRERVSDMLRNNMADPAVKKRATEAMKTSFATPKSKAKRSESTRRMWQSDEYRAANAELWKDSDFRARCESGLRHGASVNSNKTRCPHGHEYSLENTVVNSRGSRECLTCTRKSKREGARARRAKAKDVTMKLTHQTPDS
jgi:hypothetical protein